MSKTQQVKQYKKQIDQLSTEVSLHRQQAEAHKSQVKYCITSREPSSVDSVCMCDFTRKSLLTLDVRPSLNGLLTTRSTCLRPQLCTCIVTN